MIDRHAQAARPRGRRAGHGPRTAGFTLIEMMIALTVLGLVLVAVFSTFFRSQRTGQTMAASVNLRQGARAAIQLLERELRMAGSGWGRIPVQIWYSGGTDSIFAVRPGPGVGGCDSVTIVGGWDVMTTLDAAMPVASAILKVVNTVGFAEGDLCVVTNGQSAHLFQVTQVNSTSRHLQHNPTSPYNPPGGVSMHAWPAGGYGVGALVYKLSWVTYAVDSVGYEQPSLVRCPLGGAAQLVAYDVSRFEVRYRMQDDTLTRDPDNHSMIDEITPMIWTRLRVQGRPAVDDSVWAAVRPRTF